MGVITYDMEVTSSCPPSKLFKALVLGADNLIPKILPQAIKTIEILEGDGGVGTVKLITFGEGYQYKCVKHKVDALDEGNYTYSYSIIDGDVLVNGFESISYTVKIESSTDGGSVCKTSSTYHTKGDAQLNEELIKGGKEKATAMFKAIEAYLQANPDAYS